jgi:PAS domain S-box-containing protein
MKPAQNAAAESATAWVRPADAFSFLPAGGSAGALIRSIDWSTTALGPVDAWPQSLRTSVSICLNSRFPMLIWWGPELVKIYNDAYVPMLGGKHPWALGKAGRDVWPEIWQIIGPMLEGVMQRGAATWSEDTMLPLARRGFTEECYFTFSYSPIHIENGAIGGVFTAVSETSAKVIGERRLSTLHELGQWSAGARSADEAVTFASTVLSSNPYDLPFTLTYLCDPSNRDRLRLSGTTGFAAGEGGAAEQIDLSATTARSEEALARSLTSGEVVELRQPIDLIGAMPSPWPEPTELAAALPIASAQGEPAGVLVVGISPRLALDEHYRSFLTLAASQIASAISSAEAYAAERRRAEGLAQIDAAKTAFFSNVSHEFRTPIALMLGPLEDLLADPEPASAASRERVEIAHRNALRLQKLVNTLLEFSRIEAGRVQAAYRPTDLAKFTTELASVFRASVERAGLRYVVRTAPLESAAYVDREMWEKIVLNLLSNAFKFTFEGEIELSLTGVPGGACLRVRDTGTGIPEEQLPHLFQRFHRVEGAIGRTQEGSGIGLALIQELTRLHGGTIAVESRWGHGTVFEVQIPLGIGHLPPESVHADDGHGFDESYAYAVGVEAERWLPDAGPARPPSTPPAAPRPRVLLADDNADMRAYIQGLLAPSWDVEAVSNGEEAMVAARERTPDLILSDVMMPRSDGFELLRRLKQSDKTSRIPVVLLSARADEESRIEGLHGGAVDYLVKPFSAKELLARVQNQLQIGQFKAAAERERSKLSSVFAQAPVGIALLEGPDHVFVIANPVYYSLLYGAPRDFVGKPVREAIPESVAQGFVALLDRVYATGEPHVGNEVPIGLVQQDGSSRRFYLNFVYQPLRDERERVHGIVAVIHDVTERVESRAAIEDSERRYRTLAESLPQLVWTCAADGRCDYLSRQWLDYTGEAERDQLEFGWLERSIHPEDRKRIVAHWMGAVRGEHAFDTEFRIRRHDGAYRWFATRATALHDSDGRITSWFGTCTDIQDRKQAEATLTFERNQLETIFRESPAAMALWVGDDLVFEKVNPRYQAIFPDRQLQGRAFVDACPEFKDQSFPGLIRKVLETGQPFVGREVLARHADCAGGPLRDHYYDFTYLRIHDADGNAYGVYDHAIDVTDRVRDRLRLQDNEQRLEKTVADLETERDLRERFVAMLTHDLRTPLHAAKMCAQVIHKKAGDTDVVHNFAGRIADNLGRADEMIRNLLDASRLKAGERLAIEVEACNLNEIAADTLADLSTLHGDRFVLNEQASINGHWSKSEIRRIIENLCLNAIKYGAPYRPVRITLLQQDEHVDIEVRNDGAPISRADQEKLFQPFKRIGGPQAGGSVGWGLGLTLVKGIAEAHGGGVSVDSSPEQGTAFRVTLLRDSRGANGRQGR